MSVSPARLNAISAANNFRVTSTLAFKESHSAALYGQNVFNEKVMQARLPKGVFKALKKTIDTGAPLDSKDGPNQAGFSIDNPNAQRTCGCGSSFS